MSTRGYTHLECGMPWSQHDQQGSQMVCPDDPHHTANSERPPRRPEHLDADPWEDEPSGFHDQFWRGA